MKRARRSAKISQRSTQVWATRIKLLPGWRKIFRLAVRRPAAAHGISIVKPNNFFAELRRRNVYKIAVAYAVVGWLLIQAASIVLPTFEAPPWILKVVIFVLIIGFPVALIFSWAFELTPEGLKRTEDVDLTESMT